MCAVCDNVSIGRCVTSCRPHWGGAISVLPRSVRQPHRVQQPRSVHQPRCVHQPRSVHHPRSVHQPRSARQPRNYSISEAATATAIGRSIEVTGAAALLALQLS